MATKCVKFDMTRKQVEMDAKKEIRRALTILKRQGVTA